MKKFILYTLVIYILATQFLFKTLPTFASEPPFVATSAPHTIVSEQGIRGLVQIINNARNIIFAIIIIIGVLFIILSGGMIITSGGNETQLKKGKAMLKNTIIGIVVAILSASIVLVTISLIEG